MVAELLADDRVARRRGEPVAHGLLDRRSASLTGVRSGFVATCEVVGPEAGHRDRVGAVGEFEGQRQMRFEVHRPTLDTSLAEWTGRVRIVPTGADAAPNRRHVARREAVPDGALHDALLDDVVRRDPTLPRPT